MPCPHRLDISWGRDDQAALCGLDDGPCMPDCGKRPTVTYTLPADTPDGTPTILTIPQAIAAGLMDEKSPAPVSAGNGTDQENLTTK